MKISLAVQEAINRFSEEGKRYIALRHACRFESEEIKETKKNMMENTDWEKIGIKFKYDKEDHIKMKMADEFEALREKRQKRDEAYLGMKSAKHWKDFLLEVYTQEGDIDFEPASREQFLKEMGVENK